MSSLQVSNASGSPTLLDKISKYAYLDSNGNEKTLSMDPKWIKTDKSTTMRKINKRSKQSLVESVQAFGWHKVLLMSENCSAVIRAMLLMWSSAELCLMALSWKRCWRTLPTSV